ncbi:type VII secretion protein EccCa [Streptomyces noursei]|uniref:type VII secretion protein EccCa n=1 Tax=Streptomyces noursei TaxID=1971 RepID=UPI0037F40951
MGTVNIKRRPRKWPDDYSKDEIRLKAPPALPRQQNASMALMLLPALGMAGTSAFFFLPDAPAFMRVMGAIMVLSSLGMALAQIVRARRGPTTYMSGERRRYLSYLARTREQVVETARLQRQAECYLFPEPGHLWALVAQRTRLWERRLGDRDFAEVRIGVGPQRLATELVLPQEEAEEWEPLTERALSRFVATHARLDGLPLALSLRAFPWLTVRGETAAAYGLVRAVIGQLTTLHAPEDLRLAVVAAPGAVPEWEWIKWLPHAYLGGEPCSSGSGLLVCDSLDELEEVLAEDLAARPTFLRDAQPLLDRPHLVVLMDSGNHPPTGAPAEEDGLQGVTVVEVALGQRSSSPSLYGQPVLTVSARALRLETGTRAVYSGTPDALSSSEATALARALAPLRTHAQEAEEPLLSSLDFTELMGIADPADLDVAQMWRQRRPADRLHVPIGVDQDGNPVVLDLKEASQGGMGPHGLCVGATGSGKSELLRTLVLGLAATHSPEALNFVLADFKGGASFAGLADLPHVSALITNLNEDLALVDRMHDAITGELVRRQELLHTAGNFTGISDYEKAREAGAPLEPLPTLLLVLDEFSELLAARPDFLHIFLQIGRIGRSLGMHLLLATQRLETGRLHGLDTYLSYRLALRTFSAQESQAVLGTPDAYYLRRLPGAGLLQHSTASATEFQAAYVSGPYHNPHSPRPGQPTVDAPILFTAESVRAGALTPASPTEPPRPEPSDPAAVDTVLDVIARQLAGYGPDAHPIWLPPLEMSPSLGQLLPPLTSAPERGLHPTDHRAPKLTVPLGVTDKPLEQRHATLTADLAGAGGHTLVVGGPRTGKSTLLRTLVLALALTHTPAEVQFYGLDFGGGSLFTLADLPHTGGIASRLETDRARRSVAEVRSILNSREEFFHSRHIDSMATYRVRRADGHYPDHPWGDVFLVIDGWVTFRREFEHLVPDIEAIALRGLAHGIHLIITATRYNELRPALRDQFGTRLELRLANPLDSEHDRRRARNVPANRPGHGLAAGGFHFITALPHIEDADTAVASPAKHSDDLVAQIASRWSGPVCPPVRLLPTQLSAYDLPKADETLEDGFAIGVDETTLAPVHINFDTDPLLVIYGERESGKTALLRLLARRIAERHQPREGLFMIGDYRRGLYGQLPEAHLLHYAPVPTALHQGFARLAPLLGARIPPGNITAHQMRTRSWWRGPNVYVIIDDYDLVALPSGNPLDVLADYLPYARDIGLRVIVASNAAGAASASFEAVTRRLKDLGAQGIIFSGSPEEGPLMGNVKATSMPPGRAQLVPRKRASELIQIGFLPTGG